MDEQTQCDECCGRCRFWKRNLPSAHQEKKNIMPTRGRCRFNPPQVAYEPHRTGCTGPIPSSQTMLWPDTPETDWCGKFEEQKSAHSPKSLGDNMIFYGPPIKVSLAKMSAREIKYKACIHPIDILYLVLHDYDDDLKELRDDEVIDLAAHKTFISQPPSGSAN